jgi:hypothetical protein
MERSIEALDARKEGLKATKTARIIAVINSLQPYVKMDILMSIRANIQE